jgi:hypothetical protein
MFSRNPWPQKVYKLLSHVSRAVGATILHVFVCEMLAYMTQVSYVAPGPLLFILLFLYVLESNYKSIISFTGCCSLVVVLSLNKRQT